MIPLLRRSSDRYDPDTNQCWSYGFSSHAGGAVFISSIALGRLGAQVADALGSIFRDRFRAAIGQMASRRGHVDVSHLNRLRPTDDHLRLYG